jgi:hypothetical protein
LIWFAVTAVCCVLVATLFRMALISLATSVRLGMEASIAERINCGTAGDERELLAPPEFATYGFTE